MHSESVGRPSSHSPPHRVASCLPRLYAFFSVSFPRSREAEVEKLPARFHPNVTDLTSRGDPARFPRIIILLSYNSFNSRESKVAGG